MQTHAGAIVVRDDDQIVRVLLVGSRKEPGQWVFPKGHVEPGETPAVAALREAFEEGGVAGMVVGSAGPALTFQSGAETVVVDYFLVRLTAEMPSPEGREKIWLLPEEAGQRLGFANARQLLGTALRQLQNAGIAGLQEVK